MKNEGYLHTLGGGDCNSSRWVVPGSSMTVQELRELTGITFGQEIDPKDLRE